MKHIEYPALARLSRWLDAFHEFLNLINGLVLWIGLAIALVDVLTLGELTASLPWLVWVWAVSQAIGVDGFLYHFSSKAGEHIRLNNWRQAAFFLAVVGGLGFVAWQASYVFNFQQLNHTTVTGAIGALGWTTGQWLAIRTGLSVAMVVLSGLTRYEKASKRESTPVVVMPMPQETPQVIVSANLRKGIRARASDTIHIVPARAESLRRPRESVRPRARAAWDAGAQSKPAMMKHAGISNASAAKYIAEFSGASAGSPQKQEMEA